MSDQASQSQIVPATIALTNAAGLALPRAWRADCQRLIKGALKRLNIVNWEVSVAMVKPEVIKELNQRYRRQRQVTDVLSFTYAYQPDWLSGEIIICLAQAKAQARRRRHSLRQELNTLLVHGCLHLAGYDHHTARQRRQMSQLADQVLTQAAKSNYD